MRWEFLLVVAAVAVLLITACSEGDDEREDFVTLRVPEEFESIQAAVDAATSGDLILISPGVYREAVDVTTDGLTIRGLDRNTVILDGEFERDNGVRVLEADGVAVENMTARNYRVNGFFWTGVTGYRGSYLTAYRNGDYGFYAFGSVQGQFDHSYASGSPDAGFYIGQCYPCDALITDVLAEHNGLGYSGTNAGGNLLIVNSVWRNNRVGIVPNTGSYELCYPERETTIVGNVVHSNNQADTPAIDIALLAMGNGILVAGGLNNVIERNLVYDHDKLGIGLVPFAEENATALPPPDDELDEPCLDASGYVQPDARIDPQFVLWHPKGNRVSDNVVDDSRLADLGVGTVGADVDSLDNCFSGNQVSTTAPNSLESLAPCVGAGDGDWENGSLDLIPWLTEEHPPSTDYRDSRMPPAQPNMPNADSAPPRPATDVPEVVTLDSIVVPDGP